MRQETGDVTVDSLRPITATHLLLFPASAACLVLGGRPQSPLPARMLPLLLSDYSAAANQYSEALGMEALQQQLLRVESARSLE